MTAIVTVETETYAKESLILDFNNHYQHKTKEWKSKDVHYT